MELEAESPLLCSTPIERLRDATQNTEKPELESEPLITVLEPELQPEEIVSELPVLMYNLPMIFSYAITCWAV